MQQRFFPSFFIYFFIVALILVRPCLVFGSPSIRTSLLQETKTFGLVRAVRKRKEYNYAPEDFVALDDQFKKIKFPPQQAQLLVRKWLQQLLFTLSTYLSHTNSSGEKIVSASELSPHNDHYISLSVFRI